MESDREQRLAALQSDLLYLLKKAGKNLVRLIGQIGLGVTVANWLLSLWFGPFEPLLRIDDVEIGDGHLENAIEALWSAPIEPTLFVAGLLYVGSLAWHFVFNAEKRETEGQEPQKGSKGRF